MSVNSNVHNAGYCNGNISDLFLRNTLFLELLAVHSRNLRHYVQNLHPNTRIIHRNNPPFLLAIRFVFPAHPAVYTVCNKMAYVIKPSKK